MEKGPGGQDEHKAPEAAAATSDAILTVLDSQGNAVDAGRKGGEPPDRHEKENIDREFCAAFVLRDGIKGAPAIDGGAPEIPVYELARTGQADERELLATRIIDLLNSSGELAVTVHGILDAVMLFSGAEAAGIRLCQGDDYPYYESAGFAPTHLRTESSLCARDPGGMPERDGGGIPLLECMCGNILKGRIGPAMPCFTKYGSFWTSDLSGLLESMSETQRRMFSRGVCIAEGYQSMALIPLRSGNETVGLLQLNDRRIGRFGLEMVEYLEMMGESVGVAFARKVALDRLKGSERDMALHNRMADIFLTIPEKDTYPELLAVILKAMDSRLGVLGVIDEDGALALRSMTRQLLERPLAEGVMPVFPRDVWGDNPWSRALNARMVVWSNEPTTLLPHNHAAVKRHISQPIVHKGEAIGLLCVADRETAYAEADIVAMRAIADHLAPVLHARLERDSRMKERDRADAALLKSEANYRELFTSSPAYMMVMKRGKCVMLNPAGVRALGLHDSSEAIGLDALELIVPEQRELVRQRLAGLGMGAVNPPAELRLLARDGSRPIMESTSQLIELGGEPAILVIGHDITERKEAEKRIRHLASFPELNKSPVLEADLSGKVTFQNAAAREIASRLGLPDISAFFPPDFPRLLRELEQAPEGTVQIERRIGDRVFGEVMSLSPEFGTVRLYGTDITDRLRTEATLCESESRYRDLVGNLSDVVVETDVEGKILFVSPRVEDLFGFRPEEIVGKKFMEFAHPDDVDRARATVSGLSKEKPSFEFEFMRRHRDGRFVQVSTHGRLVETGGAPRVVAIVEDITSRKKAEEELARHRGHLEELVAERTRELNVANEGLKREMAERLRAEGERDRMFNLSIEKERQLSSIYGNIKDILYLLSVEGEGRYRFFSVNPSFFAASGLTEDRVVGRDIREVIPEPSLTLALGKFDEAIRSGKTVRWEEVTEYPTGKRYRDVVVTPVLDSAGRCTSLVGSVHDMTERLREEDERSRLASIVKDSDDAIYSKDIEGRITSWNPGAERIYGYAAGEATGRHVSFLIPPGHPDDAADMLMRVFRGEHVVHYETERITKEGKVIDISLTISPIMGSSGNIIGASTIARDITEKKQTEESVRRLNEELRLRAVQLEAANRELESFSYSVSHDLRAPLRAMDGFSQALLEDYGGRLDDAGRAYLGKVRAAASRMAQLIDDMLRLSRVSRTDMNVVDVDLSLLAASVAEELSRSEPGRSVRWTIAGGLKARGDPALLLLALENLISNAWKFTGKTDGATIEFGIQESKEGRAFFVRDNGAGFDMKHSGKLFGAFQRLHSSTEFPGTGIGLATVQRIIHRHGGRVWALGEPGKGATFYFTLDQGRL